MDYDKLLEEWSQLYPDKKLYGIPNKIFLYFHSRFPYRYCCHLFFGKKGINGNDYISIIPLLEEMQEKTIPEDKGLNCKEFIFANDV